MPQSPTINVNKSTSDWQQCNSLRLIRTVSSWNTASSPPLPPHHPNSTRSACHNLSTYHPPLRRPRTLSPCLLVALVDYEIAARLQPRYVPLHVLSEHAHPDHHPDSSLPIVSWLYPQAPRIGRRARGNTNPWRATDPRCHPLLPGSANACHDGPHQTIPRGDASKQGPPEHYKGPRLRAAFGLLGHQSKAGSTFRPVSGNPYQDRHLVPRL
jgi:hypothetical protein